MLNIDLTNQVALVIGGSRGIGAAITECLCKAGATTVFTHTGNPEYTERVDALVETIENASGSVKAVALDARDSAQAASLVERTVAQYGKLDILVSNVGQNIEGKAQDVTDDQWHQGIETNLSSAFYSIRPVLPHMLKAKCGRIILVGSSAVYNGGGGAIEYAAAKAGIDGMMMYLSKTYAREGILTNVIHPAVIETDLLKNRYPSPEDKKKLISQIPAGRLGRPEDIAGLVAYLASAWGDYICGQKFLVDGGRTVFR